MTLQNATSATGVKFLEDSGTPGTPVTNLVGAGGDLIATNAAKLKEITEYGSLRVATNGDSWAYTAASATVGTNVGSNVRGYMTWISLLDPRIKHENWINASDPYGRTFSGANFGVTSDGSAGILSRMSACCDTKPHVIILNAGNNDLATLTADQIVANITDALEVAVARGVPVILMGMWVTTLAHAAQGADARYIVQNVNNQMRRVCHSLPNCIFFDTNSVWAERTSATLASEPKAGLVIADGNHPTPTGAYRIAQALLPILQAMIKPWSSELLISPDDIYHATKNPYGMMTTATYASSNPFMVGSNASGGTGVTGFQATGLTIERAVGSGTAVASKNADGSQRLVITPDGSGDDSWYLRFANFAHGLPIGTWIKAYATITLTAWDGWVQTLLECNDVTGLMAGFSMIPYDPLGDDAGLLPNETMTLYLQTEPIQIVAAGNLRIRITTTVRAGKAGTGTIDLISMAARPIPDPRPYWGY